MVYSFNELFYKNKINEPQLYTHMHGWISGTKQWETKTSFRTKHTTDSKLYVGAKPYISGKLKRKEKESVL